MSTTTDSASILGRIRLNSLKGCPADFDQIQRWIESGRIEVVIPNGNFTFGVITAGEVPDVDDAFTFYVVCDSAGKPTHFARYDPDFQCAGSCKPGGLVPLCCTRRGELKTVTRIEPTIEADRKARGLTVDDGWVLTDGSAEAVLGENLSAPTSVVGETTIQAVTQTGGDPESVNVRVAIDVPSPFFAGTAPEWDRYTVIYVRPSL